MRKLIITATIIATCITVYGQNRLSPSYYGSCDLAKQKAIDDLSKTISDTIFFAKYYTFDDIVIETKENDYFNQILKNKYRLERTKGSHRDSTLKCYNEVIIEELTKINGKNPIISAYKQAETMAAQEK